MLATPSAWSRVNQIGGKRCAFPTNLSLLPGKPAGGAAIMRIAPRAQLELHSDTEGAGPLILSAPSPDLYFEPTGGTRYNWRIAAQEDVDNGLTVGVSTAPGGTTFAACMTVLANGNVGIGSYPSQAKLQVTGPIQLDGPASRIQADLVPNQSRPFLSFRSYLGSDIRTVLVPAPTGFRVTDQANSTYNLEVIENGNVFARGTVFQGSDLRMKYDPKPMVKYGLDTVLSLTPKEYIRLDWATDPATGELVFWQDNIGEDIGLIAQEVYEVVPEAVSKPEDETKDIWSVSYTKLVPVLIKAVQEQQAQIEVLKQEVAALKAK